MVQPLLLRPLRRGLALVAATAMASFSSVASVIGIGSQPAQAQRVVPKLGTLCPLGYVDTFNGKCSTLGLMTYTVQPTNGQPCPTGWANVGGGYCRNKI